MSDQVKTKPFVERLAAGETLVADGATGTNHQQSGLGIGVAPEEWVYDRPESVLALHRAFIEAGADIILTNTFGATRLRLRESPYAHRAPELNLQAASLATQAASSAEAVMVAGSMGPTGILMEPLGELRHAEAVDTFAEQAGALAEGGVDLIVLETFFALEEALAAIEGVRRASRLPVVVSFSFDQGTKTMMGVSPTKVVEAMAPLDVTAIGANCGKSLEGMERVVREMAALESGIPLWAKPNAGLPRMVGDVAEYDTTPATMAAYADRFIRAGAQVVGGCCGSSPAHIAAIASAVRRLRVR